MEIPGVSRGWGPLEGYKWMCSLEGVPFTGFPGRSPQEGVPFGCPGMGSNCGGPLEEAPFRDSCRGPVEWVP